VRYCVALVCGGADAATEEESAELEVEGVLDEVVDEVFDGFVDEVVDEVIDEEPEPVLTGPGSLLLTLRTSLLVTTSSLCVELLMVGASFCLGSITANVTETATTATKIVEMRAIFHFFRESIVVAGAEMCDVGFSRSGPAFWLSSLIVIILAT